MHGPHHHVYFFHSFTYFFAFFYHCNMNFPPRTRVHHKRLSSPLPWTLFFQKQRSPVPIRSVCSGPFSLFFPHRSEGNAVVPVAQQIASTPAKLEVRNSGSRTSPTQTSISFVKSPNRSSAFDRERVAAFTLYPL